MNALDQATKLIGSQAKLASLLGLSGQSTIANWKLRGNEVPAEHCLKIEKATNGAVTRQELRPHDYWLIWSDLPAPKQEDSHV